MPIKPENRALYPPNWKTEIRPRILARAQNKCEQCGVENYADGARDSDGVFHPFECQHDIEVAIRQGRKRIRIILTIAHLGDPNPANCADTNLAALCQRCHNILDMPMRKANAAKTRRERLITNDIFANA